MNIYLYLSVSLCVLFYRQVETAEHEPVGPIATFIRTNIIGFPVLHESQKWVFDPDIALKRRKDFVQSNGDKAKMLIEKYGLGADDPNQGRLKRQPPKNEANVSGSNWLTED